MNPELFFDNQLGIYPEYPVTPPSGSKASWLHIDTVIPCHSLTPTLPPLQEPAAMALPHEVPQLVASCWHVDLFLFHSMHLMIDASHFWF